MEIRCGWFGEGRGQCLLDDGHRGEHTCEEDGLQAIRERDARDYMSTKDYGVLECRQDRRALLSMRDARAAEVLRLREALQDIVDERRTDEDGIYHRLACTADMVKHAAAAIAPYEKKRWPL